MKLLSVYNRNVKPFAPNEGVTLASHHIHGVVNTFAKPLSKIDLRVTAASDANAPVALP